MKELNFFFEPKTVAIIGASDQFRFGYATTNYLLNSKFKTYPVNIKKDEILGHKAYKNIKDIPDEIDLAIILIGNDYVLDCVKDCIEKGVKGIVIESAGFAETGIEKYIAIQNEITKLAKEGFDCKYGDAADSELLNKLNFSKIKMVVSTIHNLDTNLLLISKIDNQLLTIHLDKSLKTCKRIQNS